MKLLVSIRDRQEAGDALAGGADIIDAKDPASGALGAVSVETLRHIRAAAPAAHQLSAALGDADTEAATERRASAYAKAGARLVKIGFAGIADTKRVASRLAAAVLGARSGSAGRCGVVGVAYADAHRVASLPPGALASIAADAGAVGVLIDTADKDGPGVRDLLTQQALREWITNAHNAGLLAAVAGKLRADDLTFVREAGADIAGVRGAACEGGRTGHVTADLVRALQVRLQTG